jgi:hypothetical protein
MSLKHYASHTSPDASRTTSPGAWAYMSAATAARRGKLPPATGPGAVTAVANMRKQLERNGTQTKAHVTAAERKTAAGNMRALIGRSDAA